MEASHHFGGKCCLVPDPRKRSKARDRTLSAFCLNGCPVMHFSTPWAYFYMNCAKTDFRMRKTVSSPSQTVKRLRVSPMCGLGCLPYYTCYSQGWVEASCSSANPPPSWRHSRARMTSSLSQPMDQPCWNHSHIPGPVDNPRWGQRQTLQPEAPWT